MHGDLTSIRRGGMAQLDGREIELTAHEFDLLYLLASNPGIVFSREALVQRVWGGDTHVTERSVDTLVKRVRRKIEADPRRAAVHPDGVGHGLQVRRCLSPVWYRSLYWRIASGFIALLAALLVVQGCVFLWLTDRIVGPSSQIAAAAGANAVAGEIARRARQRSRRCDLDPLPAQQVRRTSTSRSSSS